MTTPADNLRDRIAALFRQPPGSDRLGDATPGEIADAVLAALPMPGPCSCGGRGPLNHLHADTHEPTPEFQPCRTTRHCADHGWCHRCDPEFADVMARVNKAVQDTDPESRHWGRLYAAIAAELRQEPTVARQVLGTPTTDPAPCVHPEGYEGECPCPPSCPCCNVTAAALPASAPAAPADRAAVLLWAAEHLAARCPHLGKTGALRSCTCPAVEELLSLASREPGAADYATEREALLRRLADEAQPTEAWPSTTETEAWPTETGWIGEVLEDDGAWMFLGASPDRSVAERRCGYVIRRHPEAQTRIVRKTTTYTVEPATAATEEPQP